jgi:uncharacterized circularly permuted ATP-grasp superfamily protein
VAQAVWPPYRLGPGYDEIVGADGEPRAVAHALWRHLANLGPEALIERQRAADREIRTIGVTFRTADGDAAVDRPWPFDVVPRIIDSVEWIRLRHGLAQRLRALNLFLDDIYHAQRCVHQGVIDAEVIFGSPNFRPECFGVRPPGGVWAHICGSDLVRGEDGTFYVLEDNLRVPSGVSYLLENRLVTKHILPELFRSYSVEPVDPYVGRLAELLCSLVPEVKEPTIVLLTPGLHNPAYFEHAFLAQQLGIELVEGGDLVVLDDDMVYMRTVGGLERVHVVYRRIDDAFLDPAALRRDSVIGVPGLMRSWRAGHVALVNAPGTGVADDKAVYAFVPELIRFYLGEEPLLPNVPTWRCGDPDERKYVLANLESLVIKPANESGGYGIVIGPSAGAAALDLVAARIEMQPRNWVAQPLLSLSTMPTLHDGALAPRHVDLRPFSLLGPSGCYVASGGLTRVAREEGTVIVNSSQGGGSKDTWIVDRTLLNFESLIGTTNWLGAGATSRLTAANGVAATRSTAMAPGDQ